MPALELDADKQAFVDAVMRPLGDDAPRRELLEECLAVAETYPRISQGDPVELATQRMQATAASFPWRHRLGLVLPALLCLIATWFCVLGPPALRSIDQVLLANRMSDSFGSMCCMHHSVPGFPYFGGRPDRIEDVPALRRFIGRIEPERRLLLLGDLGNPDEIARWKAVWDRYPDDVAHFYAYALEYHRIYKSWPADLVQTGERLDPGNGWFRFLVAEEMIQSAIGQAPPPKLTKEERRARAAKPPADPPKPPRTVVNPAVHAAGFAMLEEALAMPRWDDYWAKLNRIRFEANGAPPQDFAAHTAQHVIAQQQPEGWDHAWIAVANYREVFTIAAEQAAKAGDRERLEWLGRTQHRVGERMGEMPGQLISRLVARNVQINGSRAIAKAWDDLDERERARPFEDLVRALDPKRRTPVTLPQDALDKQQGSGFALGAYKGSRYPNSTPVTEPELRGGRMAEYALYERFVVHAAAVFLFLIALVLGIGLWRDRKLLGTLPARVGDLLRPEDRAWILVTSVLLPTVLYVVSTRSAWLAPRETGLGEERFILWLLQAGSLVTAAILLTLHTTRRRLARRGVMLAMEIKGPIPKRWPGLLALIIIPLGTVMPQLIDHGGFVTMLAWTTAGFMAGIPFLWLLNLAAYQFAGNPARRLHRAVLLRSLLWPVALLMVLAAAAIPLLQAEERVWIGQLGYDELTPEQDLFNTRPEQENADGIHAETKKALESLK